MLLTNEDIDRQIKELDVDIASLPKADDPLTKEERKRRALLTMKKEVLLNIKIAREKHRQNDELFNTTAYGLLNTWGGKHPFLMHLLLTKFRWNIL